MTKMFDEVHYGENFRHLNRVGNSNFSEVLYADDTICVSTDTKAMNKFSKDIGDEGAKYGLMLNKGKCEFLATSANANIK